MSRTPASAAGIVTAKDGERVVAASRRADGSVRKEIKIRPGYVPPEDVARYANAKVESTKLPDGYVVGLGVVGKNKKNAAFGAPVQEAEPKSKSAKKNEKRKAKKREGGGEDGEDDHEDNVAEEPSSTKAEPTPSVAPASGAAAAPSEDPAKQLRNLKKKLGQAQELKAKKAAGESLLPEQEAKVAKVAEMEAEVADLEAKLAAVKV